MSPQLLVPPVERGMLTLAVAGGKLELGDRVACLRNTGKLRCTLVLLAAISQDRAGETEVLLSEAGPAISQPSHSQGCSGVRLYLTQC